VDTFVAVLIVHEVANYPHTIKYSHIYKTCFLSFRKHRLLGEIDLKSVGLSPHNFKYEMEITNDALLRNHAYVY